MKKPNIIKLLICIVIASLPFGSKAKCITSWEYYQPVTVSNNTSTALSKYQVKVVVNTSILISAGKMISTGDDIRFVDPTTCSNLNYWIESGINSSTTIIWVKLVSLAANGNEVINMYYGNPAAPAASNGDSTFIIFDDFIGTSLNTSKWSITTSGNNASVVVTGGNLVCSTTAEANIRSASSFPSPLIEECNMKAVTGSWESMAIVNSGSDDGTGLWLGDYDYATGSNGAYHMWTGWTFLPNNPNCNYYTGHFTDSVQVSDAITGIWQISWPSSNVQKLTWPGGSFSTANTAKTLGNTVQIAVGNMCGATGSMSVDWIRARSYSATEPTTSVGAEVINHNSSIESEPVVNDVSIFPNPAENIINVDLSKINNSVETLQWIDINGNEIRSINVKSESGIISLNTNSFSRGVYFIRLIGTNETILKKIVLE